MFTVVALVETSGMVVLVADMLPSSSSLNISECSALGACLSAMQRGPCYTLVRFSYRNQKVQQLKY